MNKLYAFKWNCGRMGMVSALFVADDAEVKAAIGKEIYFGEILGKHSEISGTLNEKDLTVKSDDLAFITKLVEIIGDATISGHNPLSYLADI